MRTGKWLLAVVVVSLVIILGACPPVTGPNDPITEPDDSAPQAEYLGTVLAASGGFGTGASASVAARAIAGSVTELNIGSADIFAFSYDEANGRWDSPAGISGTGNTYDNDPRAILNADGLSFTPGGSDLTDSLAIDNMPDLVEIIHIDNSWHNVTVDGVQYGDHDRNGARESRTNRLPDGMSFTQFDIVYVNRAIVPVDCLVRRSGGALVMETENVANESAVLGAIEKISSEVRSIEQYALFIPIDPVAYDESTTVIVIGVRTDNLISEVDDSSVIYALDENRSPLTYVISVRNE